MIVAPKFIRNIARTTLPCGAYSTLFLPCSSRSSWGLRRAFHVNTSSVKCWIVRFDAKYASASLGGGLAAEILLATAVGGLLIRTCGRTTVCSAGSSAPRRIWPSTVLFTGTESSFHTMCSVSQLKKRETFVDVRSQYDQTTSRAAIPVHNCCRLLPS